MFTLLSCFSVAMLTVYRSPMSLMSSQSQFLKLTTVSLLTAICSEVAGENLTNNDLRNSNQNVDICLISDEKGVCRDKSEDGTEGLLLWFPSHLNLTWMNQVLEQRFNDFKEVIWNAHENNIWTSWLTENGEFLPQPFCDYINLRHALLILVLTVVQWLASTPSPRNISKKVVNNSNARLGIKLANCCNRKEMAYWIASQRRKFENIEESPEEDISHADELKPSSHQDEDDNNCIAWFLVSNFLQHDDLTEQDVIRATETAVCLSEAEKEIKNEHEETDVEKDLQDEDVENYVQKAAVNQKMSTNSHVQDEDLENKVQKAVVKIDLQKISVDSRIPKVTVDSGLQKAAIENDRQKMSTDSHIEDADLENKVQKAVVKNDIQKMSFDSRIPKVTVDSGLPKAAIDNNRQLLRVPKKRVSKMTVQKSIENEWKETSLKKRMKRSQNHNHETKMKSRELNSINLKEELSKVNYAASGLFLNEGLFVE